MQLKCEIFVSKLLPCIRAIIAKTLIEKHKLTQQEVASKLYVTQGAVSQYVKNVRGKQQIDIPPLVMKKIETFSELLAKRDVTKEELHAMFCEVCRLFNSTINAEKDRSNDARNQRQESS